MLHTRDVDQQLDLWRPGVRTRMYVSAVTGSSQLVIFEQWCDPGHGAPRHTHSVEEVLRVLSGEAEITVGSEHARVGPEESVVVPPGIEHGFTNIGDGELHTQAILAAPVFEAQYVESGETSYRWAPETVD